MSIGTAKPTLAEQALVPHHLIDVLDPWEGSSIDWYLARAADAATEVRARGRQPLFVGGTPLYLKAALRGMFAGPPADESLRATLAAEISQLGSAVLHRRLAAVDPAAGQRIDPADARRIIRALEVYQLTGRPISSFQQQFAHCAEHSPRVVCLQRPTADLYSRINSRVESMLRDGWLEETQALLAAPHGMSRQALQAVGYRELVDYLQPPAGSPPGSWGALVERIQARTRQFSRRQRTWFRSLEECTTIEVGPGASIDTLVSAALKVFRQGAACQSP